MNNWKEKYYVLIWRNYDIELETNVAIINFIENLIEETKEEAKKEERERIINEIENVVNWLFMNYEEKIDIMKERLEEFKTNK